jgi:hypothetical protein
MRCRLWQFAVPLIAAIVSASLSAVVRADTVPIFAYAPQPGTTTVFQVLQSGGVRTLTNVSPGANNLTGTIVDTALKTAYTSAWGPLSNPVKLSLGGLNEVGAAVVVGSTIIQDLSTGSFELRDASSNLLLAAGTITGAQITATTNSGAVLSGVFRYDQGRLYDLFPSVNLSNPGDFSWSLTKLGTGNFTTSLNGGVSQLAPFTANSAGTFDAAVVPLPPAVWAGLSLMGLMGIKGYRRQRLIKAGE